jgi:hypothetical protein
MKCLELLDNYLTSVVWGFNLVWPMGLQNKDKRNVGWVSKWADI